MKNFNLLSKTCFFFFLLLHICQTGLSQTDTNITRFTHSLMRRFDAFASHENDTALFTQALLVIQINNKYNCDSVFFTDSAPDWQKAELKRVLPKIDLNAISQYAKTRKHSGKLIIPFIIKSELIKDAIGEWDVFGRFESLFSHNGNALSGRFLILPPMGITVGQIIRCYGPTENHSLSLPEPIKPRY
ncbi:hypothetical protein [Niabella hibiscisoli]|uniref:hypothetical protein n=1 Tax=Niabella hibiscisoli TaxID=1825928 RepID=UPI001F10EC55|nr:hypothetical protein [Niabella hibiscisoli]MCH5716272.1 hypothetical protein [Niabella hibiscisoli]